MSLSQMDPHSARPKVRDEVLWRQMDDGFILYDPIGGKVHSLNPVAAYIWDSLDGSHSIKKISESLQGFPGTEGYDILGDVLRTVESFRNEGLLEATGQNAE